MMDQQDQSKTPSFKTWQEEAAFWDTHDTTEFKDEFEPVDVIFAQSLLRRGLAVPLDPQAADLLDRFAKEQGTEPATLARRWILDRLRVEMAHSV